MMIKPYIYALIGATLYASPAQASLTLYVVTETERPPALRVQEMWIGSHELKGYEDVCKEGLHKITLESHGSQAQLDVSMYYSTQGSACHFFVVRAQTMVPVIQETAWLHLRYEDSETLPVLVIEALGAHQQDGAEDAKSLTVTLVPPQHPAPPLAIAPYTRQKRR